MGTDLHMAPTTGQHMGRPTDPTAVGMDTDRPMLDTIDTEAMGLMEEEDTTVALEECTIPVETTGLLNFLEAQSCTTWRNQYILLGGSLSCYT